MRAPFRKRHPKAFAALFIAAVSVAAFGLLLLQVIVPILVGPWGLVLILLFDLSLYLVHRSRYGHPRKRPRSLITFGPVDKRYRARRRDALEEDLMATYALIVFLAGVYVVGFVLRAEFLQVDPGGAFYILGSVMTMISVLLLAPWWGPFAPWGIWAQPTESERFDTTEDH